MIVRRFTLVLIMPCLLACEWDHDTLQMERSRFPTTLEVVTGKFLRHSPEFYEWRANDRRAKLERDANHLPHYDDLSVSLSQLGRHDEAIAVSRKALALNPDRYETHANLGTFLIFAGQLDKARAHIKRALEINPDAHFGREKYQLQLIDYVRARIRDGNLSLPLREVSGSVTDSDGVVTHQAITFARHLATTTSGQREKTIEQKAEQRAEATKAILGMMRQVKYDMPILLEALASVLLWNHTYPPDDGKLLGVRALLQASYIARDAKSQDAYRTWAREAIHMQTRGPNSLAEVNLEEVEADFQRELADARAWYDDLRQRELTWIHESADPEAEFDRLYRDDPAALDTQPPTPLISDSTKLNLLAVSVLGGLASLALAVLFSMWWITWRFLRATQTPIAITSPPDTPTPRR